MTIYETPQQLADAEALVRFNDYRAEVDAAEDKRNREREYTAALAAHRDVNALARQKAEAVTAEYAVKVAAIIIEFRDAIDAANAIEVDARTAAIEARHAVHPDIRRSMELGSTRDHGQPATAGHVVAGVLERIQREHSISLPEKHWSQI